jgi:hypothetical protein
MDGMSGRCLACQADLRPDARFCPRCGQRAVAGTQDSAYSPTITALASPPAAGSPMAGPPAASPPAVSTARPEPEPTATARGDWDDWYTITPPRPTPPRQAPPPQTAPPQSPRAALPPSPARPGQHYPQYPPDAFLPPALSAGQMAPGSVPLQRQPGQYQPGQLQPLRPQAPVGPQGYEPWRPYSPPGPPPGPPRGSRRRSESNAGLWAILLLLLAGAGAGLVLLLAHPFGNHSQRQAASGTAASRTAPAGGQPAAPGSATASRTAGTATSPGAVTSAAERRAASGVASMLLRSAADRSAIIGAATAIGNCGPGLASAPKVFGDAAASRRSMLAGLAAMPGRDTLPPALVSDLTQAWQASAAADQAYAQWANDEITQGCVRDDTSDPGYRATVAPDRQASQYKDSFVALWNPLASGYGLTQYTADQF